QCTPTFKSAETRRHSSTKIVFSFVIRIFSKEFLMNTKFIIASRDFEECLLVSALLNVGVHCLYGEYVIFKSPIIRIGGNQLGGVYLWVVGSDGIASLILTALNVLSSINSV
ncbi:MAG: hypothetical protein EZS28_037717, partial [Streblomastix strix]